MDALSSHLYQTWMKWFPIPLPPPSTFSGQTAVITGGTSGLGLATAAHLINLGAAEVIISSRNPSRSQQALEELEIATRGQSIGRVKVFKLDMASYASVINFADEVKAVKKGTGGIDIVILNAGIIGTEPKEGNEGWEQNIQVNTLSTVLLASLLLPHMKSERRARSTPAHFTFVGSMRFADPNIAEWTSWQTKKNKGALEHLGKPQNWPGPQPMYAATKLLVTYAFRELVERTIGPDSRPEVILNILCPGIVKTDLSRNFRKKGAGFVALIGIYTLLFGKSSENGARTYVASVMTTENEHGRFVQFYKNENQMKNLEAKVITSDAGRRMQSQVWKEITAELITKVPQTQAFLGA